MKKILINSWKVSGIVCFVVSMHVLWNNGIHNDAQRELLMLLSASGLCFCEQINVHLNIPVEINSKTLWRLSCNYEE